MSTASTQRTWGARFSVTDGVAIVVMVVATVWSWPALGRLALFFPVVLGHFFLFCNIFRVRRSYELIWTAIFLLNVFVSLRLGIWDPLWITVVQSPLTALFVGLEMRSPRYHGVLANKVNARLDDYLHGAC